MLAVERRNKIIELLHQEQRILVSQLSRMFDVTEETIRRDLEKLEATGILSRTYGGAVLNRNINEELPFVTRKNMHIEMKHEIAMKARHLIKDGDTLMIDASTTVFEFIKLLANRKNITIITNSIVILQEFASSSFTIISTGGELRAQSMSLVGQNAIEQIQRYHVDFAIMGCKGLDVQRGIMDSNEAESHVKHYMLRQANNRLLLADGSKFNKTAFVKFAELRDVNYLVTDTRPADSWLTQLERHQVELIY